MTQSRPSSSSKVRDHRTAPAAVLPWRPRVTHQAAAVDLDAAEKAAADLLTALGQPVANDEMAGTPRRMAHAYAEMLTVGAFDFTTFPQSATGRKPRSG